jgi:hypothetical protein
MICSTKGCFNDKEYGDVITYWQDSYESEKFNAKLKDFCLICRIENKRR